jgi:hypothetical protein
MRRKALKMIRKTIKIEIESVMHSCMEKLQLSVQEIKKTIFMKK